MKIRRVTPALIKMAAEYAEVDPERIMSRPRFPPLPELRFAISYVAHKYYKLSLPRIASEMDKRNHTTILYHVRKAKRLMRNPEFSNLVAHLKAEIEKVAA